MGCSSSLDNPRKPDSIVTTNRNKHKPGIRKPGSVVSTHRNEPKPDIIHFDNHRNSNFHKAEFPNEVRELIRRTWRYMEPNMIRNGLGIFKRIFEYSPEVKTLFGLGSVPDELLLDHPKVRSHAARFMNAVGASVDNLDHIEDTLTQILLDLGEAHKKFPGFDSDYFDTFYMAMTAQWETVMGPKFTRDIADAWAHLFAFMMEKLKEGYYSTNE